MKIYSFSSKYSAEILLRYWYCYSRMLSVRISGGPHNLLLLSTLLFLYFTNFSCSMKLQINTRATNQFLRIIHMYISVFHSTSTFRPFLFENCYMHSCEHALNRYFCDCSAISVELYYIFSTLWGRDQYTLWGILGIVYMMVLMVTACITVALVYFQLNAEDYRWWWRSIFTAGYVPVFIGSYDIVGAQSMSVYTLL